MSIKITAADRWFSLAIRKRANWTCQRCDKYYGGPTQALHCAHHHGRGKYSVRFDPRNAMSLCYGCHMYLTAHPFEAAQFVKAHLGDYNYQALWERAQDLAIGKQMRREVKEVAKHYKAEYERMETGGSFTGYL